jgi:phosphoserine phosphatase
MRLQGRASRKLPLRASFAGRRKRRRPLSKPDVQKRAGLVRIELDRYSIRIEERLAPSQIEIPRWTARQFERLVLDCNPKVAVFDCDGTLWSGDSGYGFMAWSLEQGLVSRSTTDWADNRYRAYLAGQVSEEAICGEMVQIYAGLREQELRAAAAQYISEFVRGRVFPEMAALVAALRQAGVELWAVSSTNRWVIAEGVRDFGIPEQHILAAEVRVVDGLISSEIVDVPTGAGKAASLKRVGLSNPDAVFGNSLHDLAMLELARHPFPVNPSPALLQAAAKKGWGYFCPQSAEGTQAAVAGE